MVRPRNAFEKNGFRKVTGEVFQVQKTKECSMVLCLAAASLQRVFRSWKSLFYAFDFTTHPQKPLPQSTGPAFFHGKRALQGGGGGGGERVRVLIENPRRGGPPG